jgi:uncharacterized repeat protein (TIGR01451 family)
MKSKHWMHSLVTRVARRLLVTCILGSALPASAQIPPPLPQDLLLSTNGVVYAIARQSDGGLVIGGTFRSVDGVKRKNIARLLPSGALDLQWNIGSDSSVYALAIDAGDSVFACGSFAVDSESSPRYLAKLAGSGTGEVDPVWNPAPGTPCSALVIGDPGELYVGGGFTQMGSLTRNRLAKVSTSGAGAVDPLWDPNVVGGNGVGALALGPDGSVYVGGTYTSVGGAARANLAKVSRSGAGTVDPNWNPGPNATVTSLAASTNGSVFVGGMFTAIGGLPRNYLARLDGSGTGAANAGWNPSPSNRVWSLALQGSNVLFVGGSFYSISGSIRQNIAKLDASGSGYAYGGWSPSADKDVYALSVPSGGGTISLGGAFQRAGATVRLGFAAVSSAGIVSPNTAGVESPGSVNALAHQANGGTIVGGSFFKANQMTRFNLLRLDADGVIDPDWNPGADRAVDGLTIDGSGTIFAWGQFLNVGAYFRPGLAKISGEGVGDVDPAWAVAMEGGISSVAVDDANHVYVAGFFQSPRRFVARFSAAGSAVLDPDWHPLPNEFGYVRALAVAADGGLYIGGSFSSIDAQPRSKLAKLDAAGVLDPAWNPGVASAGGYPSIIKVDLDGSVYVGGTFGVVGGLAVRNLARVSAAGVVDAAWTPQVNGLVTGLSLDPRGYLLASGDFDTVNGVARRGVAKISVGTSATLDQNWKPTSNHFMNAAVIAENRIIIGGTFTSVSGEVRDGLAMLPYDGPQTTETLIAGADPNQSTVGQAYEVFVETTSAAQYPAGSVAVSDDQGASCGPVALDAFGQGSCVLASVVSGTRTLTAVFTPTDANLFLASSGSKTHQVAVADTELALSLSPDPSSPDEAVTATVIVSVVAPGAGTPSGHITVQTSSGQSCAMNLPTNQCSLSGGFSPGTVTINASYDGDGNYNPNSTTAQHVVYDPFSAVTITSVAPEPTVVGQPALVSYNVSTIDGTPTGTVTINASTGETCAAMVSAGSCELGFFIDGPRTLAAHYSGDAMHDSAQSAGVVHDVLDADTTLSITSHSPDPSIPNQAVTIEATLSVASPGAGTPHGSIFVSDGVESCNIAEGESSCQLALQTRGPRTLTAEYGGDGNYAASSDQVVHHVNRLPVVDQPVYAAARNGTINISAAEGVLAGASDPDGDTLTVLNPTSVVVTGIGGAVALEATGAFVYSPPADTTGVATISFWVGDGLEQVVSFATINVQPGLDLSISIDDGLAFAPGGSVVEYLIDVHNAGPADAVGALVRDMLPANLVDASWSCSAPPGASCTASGSGNIEDMITLPSGSMLTYLLSATVVASPETPVDNTVVVEVPSGTLDANSGNNSDTDIDTVGIFADGYD